MGVKTTAATIFGVIVALLGLLWLVQGLGIVQLGPVLCVADCEPITGRSVQWTVTGAIALIVGLLVVWAGRRQASR